LAAASAPASLWDMNPQLVDQERAEVVDLVDGATIRFLTPPGADGFPCVMRGTIPPGGVVPLHSHADPETFLVESGTLEGLTTWGDSIGWIPVRPGDVFHVPGDAKHAWRNPSEHEPAVTIIVSTATIGRFFREIAGPPSEEAVQRFLETSQRYGYWNATPEENAAVGISMT
jgi:quercetin dioxygenase-like cupin family protein